MIKLKLTEFAGRWPIIGKVTQLWHFYLFIIIFGLTVFILSDRNGVYIVKPYKYSWDIKDYANGLTYNAAMAVCEKAGNKLATVSQIQQAFTKNWDFCLWGWVRDEAGPLAILATTDTSPGCHGGGIKAGDRDAWRRLYAICYGRCPDDGWCTFI